MHHTGNPPQKSALFLHTGDHSGVSANNLPETNRIVKSMPVQNSSKDTDDSLDGVFYLDEEQELSNTGHYDELSDIESEDEEESAESDDGFVARRSFSGVPASLPIDITHSNPYFNVRHNNDLDNEVEFMTAEEIHKTSKTDAEKRAMEKDHDEKLAYNFSLLSSYVISDDRPERMFGPKKTFEDLRKEQTDQAERHQFKKMTNEFLKLQKSGVIIPLKAATEEDQCSFSNASPIHQK